MAALSRRQFLPALGLPLAAALLPSASAGEGAQVPAGKGQGGVFAVRSYVLRNGSQPERLQAFLKGGLLPEYAKLGAEPAIVLDAVVAAHLPQTLTILGFRSVEHWREAEQKLTASAAYRGALEQWERGDEAPYEEYSERLLTATPFSPPLAAGDAGSPARIFELRVYHSPTSRQLAALNERFAQQEIGIFHRSGIHPVLYTNGLTGDSLPNLTYLIPFESLAAREKAWAAFASDPEWIKVRAESVQKFGQIASVIQMSLWKAAPYSPVR